MEPLPIFFTFYTTLYLTAYFQIFKSWPKNLRPLASSCTISLFHGTPAVFLSLFSISKSTFISQNTPLQTLTLDYSIAYFLTDLLHYLIFHPSDFLFISHHLATLFVFLTCRYLALHGAFALLVLLMLAEVTSLFQNVWTLASVWRSKSKLCDRVYCYLSVPFYGLYSVVRGGLGPWFVVRMVGFYLSGGADGVIPKWMWVSWVFVVVMAIGVSILWVTNLWVELYRERRRSARDGDVSEKKER